MKLRPLRIAIAIGIASIALSACVYRMDVPQGNRIETSLLDQLEIGMSRDQVEFLLGTPAIVDLYQPDQWHYIYYIKKGEDDSIEKRIMNLNFVDGLLAAIDGGLNPE